MDGDATTTTPDPAGRCTSKTRGVPVALAGGGTWLLARGGLAPMLTAVRDRMYDDLVLRRAVRLADVMEAAWVLLRANYRLDDAETAALLAGADEAALVDAAVDAVLGEECNHYTYSMWARSALLANGIRPEDVDGRDLPHVLRQLVATGRAIPAGDFTSADEAAAVIGNLRSLAAPGAPAPAPEPAA